MISTRQHKYQPQKLQWQGPKGYQLEPEQGLAAGVHGGQMVRVRRWVASLNASTRSPSCQPV